MLQPEQSVPTSLYRGISTDAASFDALGIQLEELLRGTCLDDPQATKNERMGIVLAMVTALQFVEHLSNRQAADATRGRLAWRRVLHLPDDDPGVECSELDEFQANLKASPERRCAFGRVLGCLARFDGRTGGTSESGPLTLDQFLAVLAETNCLDRVICAMAEALQALAVRQPDWLVANIPAYWYERYDPAHHKDRLPVDRQERLKLIQDRVADMTYLIETLAQANLPDLTALPELHKLHRVAAEASAVYHLQTNCTTQ